MTIGEKIKKLRAGKELSQSDLAEKLGVSRQSVTKWETEGGLPEIDSLITIADTFGVTVDSLVREKMKCFSSIIQYDIDSSKDFEIDLTPSKCVRIEGHDSEKVRIEVMSDTIESLDSDIKVYIEDRKRKMSLELKRNNDLTDSRCREDLYIRVMLPRKFIERIELNTDAEYLCLRHFSTEDIEFGGSAKIVNIKDVHGQAEMDVRSDCIFRIHDLDGSVEINQMERCSTVEVPDGLVFKAVNAGRKCELSLGEGVVSDESSEDFIELNGMKNVLRIVRMG